MPAKDKYTVFSRKHAKAGYRKSMHHVRSRVVCRALTAQVPHFTKITQRTKCVR